MTDKLQDHLSYPPRALRAERAAAYLGMSERTFLRLVEAGQMPRAVRILSMSLWDRLELDAAFDAMRGEPDPDPPRENMMDKVLGFDRGKREEI